MLQISDPSFGEITEIIAELRAFRPDLGTAPDGITRALENARSTRATKYSVGGKTRPPVEDRNRRQGTSSAVAAVAFLEIRIAVCVPPHRAFSRVHISHLI